MPSTRKVGIFIITMIIIIAQKLEQKKRSEWVNAK